MNGYSRLFRSRWAALFWAVGICWTAYEIASLAPQGAPSGNEAAQTDATGATYNEADVNALRKAFNN